MKILICSDGSTAASGAVRFAGRLASGAGADVTLLGVTERPADEEPLGEALEEGRRSLAELGLEAEVASREGEPTEEIPRFAQKGSYDLVAIGAVRRALRGSYTMSVRAYRLLKVVKPPVLVVPRDPGPVERILLCSGGVWRFEEAIELTGELARAAKAGVTLFHVFPRPPAMYGGLAQAESSRWLERSRSDLASNIRSQLERLKEEEVAAEARLARGLVAEGILAEVAEGDYQLLVAGSAPGGGRLPIYVLGDVTRELVDRSDCPLLVVRTRKLPSIPLRFFRRLAERLGFGGSAA